MRITCHSSDVRLAIYAHLTEADVLGKPGVWQPLRPWWLGDFFRVALLQCDQFFAWGLLQTGSERLNVWDTLCHKIRLFPVGLLFNLTSPCTYFSGLLRSSWYFSIKASFMSVNQFYFLTFLYLFNTFCNKLSFPLLSSRSSGPRVLPNPEADFVLLWLDPLEAFDDPSKHILLLASERPHVSLPHWLPSLSPHSPPSSKHCGTPDLPSWTRLCLRNYPGSLIQLRGFKHHLWADDFKINASIPGLSPQLQTCF